MLTLANLSIRRPRTALAVWAIVAIVLAVLGLGVSRSLSPSIVVVPGSEASRAQTLTEDEFGPSVLVPILLEGHSRALDRQGPQVVVALARRADTRVMSAWSRGATGRSLRPSPGAAMIVASVARSERTMVDRVQEQIERTVAAHTSGDVRASITGQPSLDRALREESIATTRTAMLIALPVLFLLLLVGLRAPLAAAALTVFGGATAFAGLGVMALLGSVVDTDAIAVSLASMTGLALGVGFSLMILDRFHQETGPGRAAAAASAAVATTGRAILFSGTALVVALILATAIAPTPILTSLGIGVLLCSALATGAAVVVMPALLTVFGARMGTAAFPAPVFLSRGWAWLVGRGRWVTRWAVVSGAVATAALALLALPAVSLDTGPPDVSMLPASNPARKSFERVASVMGPGWPTPYNVVVVSDERPITTPALLRKLRAYQHSLARDPRVDSVVGPGVFVSTSRELKALPAGLQDSAKMLKGGKRQLGKLERGLGEAGAGATQLQQGLGAAADGAGQLGAGSGKAGAGAGKLRNGLDQARSGSQRISAGLASALTGARSLKDGAALALTGSQKLSGGLGLASKPVADGLPVFRQLAADVKASSGSVTAARGAADGSVTQLDQALAALGAMSAGKDDPRYAQARQAVEGARGSAAAAASALATADPKLQGATGVSAAAAGQVAELSTGLSRLYSGSRELSAGIAKLRAGNATLAGGIDRLNRGGEDLSVGLTALRDGAGALEAGLTQLTGGAGALQSGLAGGTGPAGQLAAGLGGAQAKVAKFKGDLPSPKELAKLQEQSPGLFDSGYFVLAAIDGAQPGDRNLATFAVNLTRGGNAGQIVVVPAAAASSPATRELGEDLEASADRLAGATGTQVAVGGPAGALADFTSETNASLPLVIPALAFAVALILMLALRAVILPVLVVLFDLLAAAATFGAMTLLFAGDDPVLGGPGYLDPMSIIGIFAAVFGISVVFQVILLARAREHFAEYGDARAALLHGLRRTAAMATGAAAVMIAAVLPFAFGDLLNARQFGIGIAIAIAIEALVVRPVLLPAAVALFGEWSWWPTHGAETADVAQPLTTSTPGVPS